MVIKKIIIGADHRGFALKEFIKSNLSVENVDIIDVGCNSAESVDYPKIGAVLVSKLKESLDDSIGIIICGSAVGVSISVNRDSDIRGAVVFNKEISKSARNHNNANVICLPADFISETQALEFIDTFLNEKFEGGRHQARVDMLKNIKL